MRGYPYPPTKKKPDPKPILAPLASSFWQLYFFATQKNKAAKAQKTKQRP
jgi:hypothetical protein